MNVLTFQRTSLVATAEAQNPFQTTLTFILTDFIPNKNKQGIPESEADRVAQSALGMPVKINLQEKGHTNAIPIGPIQRTWRGKDDDRDVLYAEALLWNNEYPEIDTYLKTAYAERRLVGTSWEVKYEYADVQDGIEWLQNVVCLGTAIVEHPAYGNTRTRMLAIAEQKDMEELQQKFDELQQLLAVREAELQAFNERVVSLETQIQEAQTQLTETETANATLQNQVVQAEAALQFQARASQVQHFFSEDEVAQKRTFILGMSDDAFAEYVQDLHRAVQKAGNAVAEVTDSAVRVPNLITKPAQVGVSDIVDYLRSKK